MLELSHRHPSETIATVELDQTLMLGTKAREVVGELGLVGIDDISFGPNNTRYIYKHEHAALTRDALAIARAVKKARITVNSRLPESDGCLLPILEIPPAHLWDILNPRSTRRRIFKDAA